MFQVALTQLASFCCLKANLGAPSVEVWFWLWGQSRQDVQQDKVNNQDPQGQPMDIYYFVGFKFWTVCLHLCASQGRFHGVDRKQCDVWGDMAILAFLKDDRHLMQIWATMFEYMQYGWIGGKHHVCYWRDSRKYPENLQKWGIFPTKHSHSELTTDEGDNLLLDTFKDAIGAQGDMADINNQCLNAMENLSKRLKLQELLNTKECVMKRDQ